MFSILLNPRDALYVPVIRLLCFFHIQLGIMHFTKQNISLANNLIDGLGPEGSKFKTFQYRSYCSVCAAVVGILNVRSYIINCRYLMIRYIFLYLLLFNDISVTLIILRLRVRGSPPTDRD